ncbi:tRNA pseudouridine synthase D [Polychaeton citri CBS 116435]|uniref:tRNA pseudouridine synthase D n=1 Tax=Polychaeton citri CBS 116435 TaxID=1314669 RepID=A0A9P4QIF2_9PEZI|nr:tRNA pseudouridine synthase D [Polychaeton citri CBS 116435]
MAAEPTANAPSVVPAASTTTAASVADQEHAVGITIFTSPGAPGFSGVLKQRYTDFLVNEVLPSGTVCHLVKEEQSGKGKKRGREDGSREGQVEGEAKKVKRDVDDAEKPAAAKEEEMKQDEPAREEEKPLEIETSINDEDKATLVGIFGVKTVEEILKLYAEILRHPTRKPRDHRQVTSQPIMEKPRRTEAHVAVRKILNAKLETSTIHETNSIGVKAAPPKGPSSDHANGLTDRTGAKQKGRLGWEQLGGEYLHFTLYKENKDTMEVLYFIASQLKLHIRNFSFAGTKDRRGVTVQRACVYRVHSDRLLGTQKHARGWRIGSLEHKKHGLDLGELMGNEFHITLRDCHFPGEENVAPDQRVVLAKEAVSKATSAFGQRGFINYYGLQRFGAFSIGTHITGKKLLQGKLAAAVESILAYEPSLLDVEQDPEKPSNIPADDIRRATAIRTWETSKDAKAALVDMPKRFQAEYSIIQFIGKKEKNTGRLTQQHDWQGALMSIQRNLRLMYVHAYQSLIWNTVAGKRWELFGDKVVEGDLVIVGEKDGDAAQHARPQEVDEDGEPIVRPAADDTAASAEGNFVRARALTKEEAESGKYSILDIVLSQPGFDVIYPKNEVGKFYEELMGSEQGGGLDPHDMRRAWKDISLSGSYRKMMSLPKNLSADVVEYRNPLAQLVETDADRLKKEAANGAENGTNGNTEQVETNSAEQQEEGESKLAVVLKFQLASSQYATMALRELMKGGALPYQPDFNTPR